MDPNMGGHLLRLISDRARWSFAVQNEELFLPSAVAAIPRKFIQEPNQYVYIFVCILVFHLLSVLEIEQV